MLERILVTRNHESIPPYLFTHLCTCFSNWDPSPTVPQTPVIWIRSPSPNNCGWNFIPTPRPHGGWRVLTHPRGTPVIKWRWCLCWENKDSWPSGEGVSNPSQQLSPHWSWKGNVAISFSKWQQPWRPLWFLITMFSWVFPLCVWTAGFSHPCQHNVGVVLCSTLGQGLFLCSLTEVREPRRTVGFCGVEGLGRRQVCPLSAWLILSVVTQGEAGFVQQTVGLGSFQLLVHKWLGKA